MPCKSIKLFHLFVHQNIIKSNNNVKKLRKGLYNNIPLPFILDIFESLVSNRGTLSQEKKTVKRDMK